MNLELNGIDVECIIGERIDERTRLQHLTVDVALEIDDKASETDELGDTVDYARLTEMIRGALVDAKCRMIERAARLVAETCTSFAAVRRARARVTKSGAIPHLASATAIYSAESREK